MNETEPKKNAAEIFGGRNMQNHTEKQALDVVQKTAWEIYNKRAAEVDKEMVKDWNDSLNTLLIFVSNLPVYGFKCQTCANYYSRQLYSRQS
jgi:hypothetical protein